MARCCWSSIRRRREDPALILSPQQWYFELPLTKTDKTVGFSLFWTCVGLIEYEFLQLPNKLYTHKKIKGCILIIIYNTIHLSKEKKKEKKISFATLHCSALSTHSLPPTHMLSVCISSHTQLPTLSERFAQLHRDSQIRNFLQHALYGCCKCEFIHMNICALLYNTIAESPTSTQITYP